MPKGAPTMGSTGSELPPAAALGPLPVGEGPGDDGREEREMRGWSIDMARSKAPPRSFSLPSFPSLLLELPGELERDVRP